MRRSHLSLLVFPQRLKTFTAKAAAAVAVTAAPETTGGGHWREKYLKGTGNYVMLPPEREAPAPPKRVSRETRRIIEREDAELIRLLRLAEAKRVAVERMAMQAGTLAATNAALARMQGAVDQRFGPLSMEEEALLLLLMAA